MPPSKYINNQKLKEATILLKTTNLTVKEIAKILNFSSSNYFMNYTPTKVGGFRERLINPDNKLSSSY